MKILAVDTSTPAGSTALLEGENLLAEVVIEHHRKHTERLIPSIDYILDQLGLEPKDIEALAVGLGPGSFTGLRIGLSTMKGMALSLGVPLFGASSLEALARGIVFSALPVWAVIDARKGQVFAALFRRGDGAEIELDGDEMVLTPEELVERIKDKAVLAGNGARMYREIFERALGGRAVFAPPGLDYPRASQVGLIALERHNRGERDDAESLVPHYIRDADALLKKKP